MTHEFEGYKEADRESILHKTCGYGSGIPPLPHPVGDLPWEKGYRLSLTII